MTLKTTMTINGKNIIDVRESFVSETGYIAFTEDYERIEISEHDFHALESEIEEMDIDEEDEDMDYIEARDVYGLHDGLFYDDNPESETCGHFI